MAGLLDFLSGLGINPGPVATQNGEVTGPVNPGGILGQFQQRLRDASPELMGFGMGMLSGGNQQEGFANAMQGMNTASRTAMLQRQQDMARQQQAQRAAAAAEYAKRNPQFAGMLASNPDLAEKFAMADYEKANRNPLDDAYKRAQIEAMQKSKEPGFNEKMYSQLTPEEQVAARKAQFGINGSENDFSKRAAAAEALGVKPDDPAYKSYVLTGKMPREDAQPLTATDKKAIMEADDAIFSSANAIDNLKKAKELSKQAYAGLGAGTRGYLGSLVGDKGGEATQNLDNLVQTNALASLKSIFGGNPTEGERAILLDIQGSSSKPDKVRQEIYDRAIAMAQRRMEMNQQRSNELRGQTYYKSGGGSGAGKSTGNSTLDAADAIVGLGGKK